MTAMITERITTSQFSERCWISNKTLEIWLGKQMLNLTFLAQNYQGRQLGR